MGGIAIALIAMIATADARAGTVRHYVDPATGSPREPGPVVALHEAAPGERNDVLVTRAADGAFVFRDAGAPLVAGAGCMPVEGSAVRCQASRAEVLLGDADDRGRVESSDVTLDGGDGDDTLSGGPDADQLIGGLGSDLLDGGPGDDTLQPETGGYGALRAGFAPDRIDGGEGEDTVSYDAFAVPVTVDLSRPGAAVSGADGAGDGDALVRVENADGGAGGAHLIGDDGDNRLLGSFFSDADDVLDGGGGDDLLWGGDGDDRLGGGPGEDELAGHSGSDQLHGGAGDDWLDGGALFDRGSDQVRCGGGEDAVADRPRNTLARDCERLAHFYVDHIAASTWGSRAEVDPRVRLSRSRRSAAVAIDVPESRAPASGSLAICLAGRDCVRATARMRPGPAGRRVLRWRLSRAAGRLLARPERVQLEVAVRIGPRSFGPFRVPPPARTSRHG